MRLVLGSPFSLHPAWPDVITWMEGFRGNRYIGIHRPAQMGSKNSSSRVLEGVNMWVTSVEFVSVIQSIYMGRNVRNWTPSMIKQTRDPFILTQLLGDEIWRPEIPWHENWLKGSTKQVESINQKLNDDSTQNDSLEKCVSFSIRPFLVSLHQMSGV